MKPSAWRGIAALVLGATLVLAAAPKALAQQPSEAPSPTPPKGPRDVITGARQAREARELERAVAPSAADPHAGVAPSAADPHAGVAPSAADPHAEVAPSAADPHAGVAPSAADPHAGVAPSAADPHAAAGPTADPHAAGPGRAPPVSRANANPELPVGTIRVRVLDHQGKPVPGAPVSLGIMKSDSSRDKQDATAGPDGEVTFSDLYVGDRQAYRVNVPYQGAKYSSTPFRLPPRGGYDVEIRRLPVTRDDRWIVMYVGATSIELKDERIKVVQQARLVNIGNATYVFPDEGTLVTLPEGFTAVQTQDVMTDQHIEEVPGKGLAFRGSLTPGEATLLWGFDLPLSGSEVSFSIGIPWAAFAYRVVADAAPGLQVDIDGMPAPSLHTDDGRRF